MRYANTNVHQLWAGGGFGRKIVVAANVTSSAATIRIFNVPETDTGTFDTGTPDQDNARVYDWSVPANSTHVFECSAAYPIVVRAGTASAINWSLEDA